MLKNGTIIKVLNRDNGAVVYSIPEMNGLRRVYQSGETKEVTFEELKKLSYLPGGKELLEDCLVILDSPEAIKELIGEVEPEYNYTRKDIIRLLQTGSLDEFLDCLDFAPQGVKDMIKSLSVELPLNDVKKREAIQEKLGFNVDNAIRIQKEISEDKPKEEVSHRRVQKTEGAAAGNTRRVVKTVKE